MVEWPHYMIIPTSMHDEHVILMSGGEKALCITIKIASKQNSLQRQPPDKGTYMHTHETATPVV